MIYEQLKLTDNNISSPRKSAGDREKNAKMVAGQTQIGASCHIHMP